MPFLAPLVGLLGGIGGTIAAGAGIATAATALATSGGGKPAPVPAPVAPITDSTIQTEADKAAEALKSRARAAGGRSSTILTSPLGVTGTGSSPTQQKTLLGQ